MRDETEDTFKWIFDEFVKIMGGKKPITILTGNGGVSGALLCLYRL